MLQSFEGRALLARRQYLRLGPPQQFGHQPGAGRSATDAGLLPYVATPRRQRLYRRAQLQVVANARLARRLTG